MPDDGDLGTTIDSAVYYYGGDGKRYVFPNSQTYFTWYADFSTVMTITDAELASMPIGGLLKSEVRALARELGVPDRVIRSHADLLKLPVVRLDPALAPTAMLPLALLAAVPVPVPAPVAVNTVPALLFAAPAHAAPPAWTRDFAAPVGLLDVSAGLEWGPLDLGIELYNVLDARYAALEYSFPSDWSPGSARSRTPARHIAAGAPRSWMVTLGVAL